MEVSTTNTTITMYKTAKGAQDLVGSSYMQIQRLITLTEKEFVAAGGEPLETPVFERTDVLLGKYGEEADTKLIYRLADEGGEPLALRYDLTVPFARYVKENGVKQMRRYSVGKVYRRDQPNTKAGRYREFYQADFDIYGEKQEGMVAEATLLNSVCRILDGLSLGYTILINDVRNLQYLLSEKMGISEWRKLCPVIDKLDKQSFASLEPEFTALDLSREQQAQLEVLLKEERPFLEKSVNDFSALSELAGVFGFREKLVFTNSLARGLDYYTGFIWEFKIDGFASTVSAGGRYDGLLGGPAAGISLGISRLATLLSATEPEWKEVYYVATVGAVSILDKMRVVKKLQESDDKPVLYSLSLVDRKLGKIITDCCTSYIRYVVIVGESELTEGKFSIKDLKEKTQKDVEI